MSEEQVNEQLEVSQPEEQEKDEPKVEPDIDLNKENQFTSGYTVGLKENGEFVFEIHGENTGLVQLLGLHEYAKYRIGFITDENQGYGSAGIIRALNHLGKQVGQLAALFNQSVQSRIIQP